MTVGENIKRIRKEKGLTQKKLGELCGINEVQIRRYELGGKNANPKLETLRRIAAGLGVYISELQPDWSEFLPEEIAQDFSNGLRLDELEVLQNYRLLNDTGKQEARKRVNELTEILKYTKK